LKLAQGILCGAWALAFPFDWASQIVDDFDLSPIPKAPVWLIGATNVDGNILPVVDLKIYLGLSSNTGAAKQRLLIGGMVQQVSADSTGDAIAIAFDGLPQQLRYELRALTYASALPPRLQELCVGVGHNAAGHEFLEIDDQRLMTALSDELAQV
jgi:chemotaxis signal transduction protein